MKFIKYLAILLILPIISSAQTVELEKTSCSADGLYKFQSTSVSFIPEDDAVGREYEVGSTINFVGYVENTNEYPIVDGYVFARLGYENDDFNTEGSNVIDEFIIAEGINIDAKSKESLEFEYTLSNNLPSGEYRMDFFYSVDKRFNLGGLPFTNEITNGYTNFVISGLGNASIALEKSETLFNSNAYRHIGSWPRISSEDLIFINQPLYNNTDEDIEVSITYDLYFWDSLDESDLIESTTETMVVPANSSVELIYEREGFDRSVGYLKITASSDDLQSIVNLRFVTDLNDTKLNYAAVDTFPILKGESFGLFGCAYNTTGREEGLEMEVTLKDSKDRVVAGGIYIGDLGTRVEGFMTESVSEKDYDYLSLHTEVRDSEGNVLDSYDTEYDCKILNSEACVELLKKGYAKKMLIYSLLVVLILATILFIYLRSKKKGEVVDSTVAGSLVAMLILSGSILSSTIYQSADMVYAQAYINGTQQTSTDVSRKISGNGYVIGYEEYTTISNPTWEVAEDIVVTRNMKGRLLSSISGIDITDLEIDDVFYVELESECTWILQGGSWDTPYCGVDEFLTSDNDGVLDGSKVDIEPGDAKVNIEPMETTTSLNYNSSILDCQLISDDISGHIATETYECTVVGGGTTILSATIDDAPAEVFACAEAPENEDYFVTDNNSGNNNPDCGSSSGWGTEVILDLYLGSYYGYPEQFHPQYTYSDNEIDMDGDTYTWTITATEPVVDASCGTAHDTEVVSQPTGSESCSLGTEDSMVDNGDNTYSWSCLGSGGGTNASCYTIIEEVDGVCGIAVDGEYSSQPIEAELCSSGSSSNVTEDPDDHNWSWVCVGSNGGADSGVCETVIPECSDGSDNDGDGEVDSDDLDCGTPYDPESGPNGASLSCTFTPPLEVYDLDQNITATAFVIGLNGDFDYSWTEDFGNSNSNSLTESFSSPGQYQARLTVTNGIDTLGPEYCESTVTGEQYVVVADMPDISFDINDSHADSDGQCTANWIVGDGANVSCTVYTIFDDLFNSVGVINSPNSGAVSVDAGNEYYMQCITNDEAAALITTESDRCILPDVNER